MSDFKGRHFEGGIVLWAVRWYCRYGVSYRDLEQMMDERGVSVDHSTIYRWVQRYAPEIEKRLRWQWRGPRSTSWRVDETYVKIRGKWAYLQRAVDKHGNTIDFYLSPTRNTAAAKRFLGKTLNGLKAWDYPKFLEAEIRPFKNDHGVWLVRPDGYTACVGKKGDTVPFEEFFAAIADPAGSTNAVVHKS